MNENSLLEIYRDVLNEVVPLFVDETYSDYAIVRSDTGAYLLEYKTNGDEYLVDFIKALVAAVAAQFPQEWQDTDGLEDE